jgi:drug/metabolite transporter (DMT)-like permease
VLEYVILPASAFWTWVIWGKGLEPLAVLGMVLIVAAGTLIALRAKAQEA